MAKQISVKVDAVQEIASKIVENIEHTASTAKNGLRSKETNFSNVAYNWLPSHEDKGEVIPAVYYASFTYKASNGKIKTITIRDQETLEAMDYLSEKPRTFKAFRDTGRGCVSLNPVKQQKGSQAQEPDEDTPLI